MSYVRLNPNSSVTKEPGDDPDHSIRGYITKGLSPSDIRVINAQLLHKSLIEQTPPTPRPESYGEITSVVEQPSPKVKVSIKAKKVSKRENTEEPTNNNSVKVRRS